MTTFIARSARLTLGSLLLSLLYACTGGGGDDVSPLRAPSITPIDAQTVEEGQLLSFNVNASNDGPSPVLSATNLPPGSSFDPATGAFEWIPAAGDADRSPFNVTFTATDPVETGLSGTESVVITVQPFGSNVSPTAAAPIITPNGGTFVDSVSVSITTATAGAVIFYTLDGSDPTENSIQYGGPLELTENTTVNARAFADGFINSNLSRAIFVITRNEPPVLNSIGDQTVVENENLNFTVTASDAESTPVLSVTNLPSGATFDSATGVFDWMPVDGDSVNSPYSVTFTATDDVDASLTVSETIEITVTEAPNETPVLDPIGNQTIEEQQPLSFAVSATDDGPDPILSTSALPSGATFSTATGVFSWTPADGDAAGSPYSITFTATDAVDAGLTDSETISITVNAPPNGAPELDPIGNQTIEEQQPLSFTVTATDDGPAAILSTSALPSGATFSTATGVFSWTPADGDAAGSPYSITFTATDAVDAGLTDSETISITVNAPPNGAPVLDPIGNQTIEEQQSLSFTATATDDGPAPILSTSALPPGASFTPATGAFSWTPVDGDAAGSPYSITFTATDAVDSGLTDSETISITVNAPPNETPELNPIGNQTIEEQQPLSFTVSATDDGPAPILSTSALPAGATFSAGTGMFSWTPADGDAAGSPYSITFIATDAVDSGLTDSETISITVNAPPNETPVLDPIGNQTIEEQQPLSFTVTATDDGPDPILSTSALPSGATFSAATGAFSWTPADGDAAGSPYSITFTATDAVDSGLTDTETISITVNTPPNETPVLVPIGSQTVEEQQPLSFTVTATDDGPAPILSTSALPPGSSFTPATGAFSWTPADGDAAGSPYSITFTATDAVDSGLTDSETINIAVNAPANETPVLDPIGNQTVEEQQPLSFTVTATDDGPVPILSTSALPTGATFSAATGAFNWTPADGDAAGSPYSITFTATDAVDSGLTDTETISITVNAPPNETPVLDPIGNQTIEEQQPLSFTVTATDDGPAPILSTSALPTGATFSAATGAFSWTPADGDAAGSPYSITFTATDAVDSGLTDSETISIDVTAPPTVSCTAGITSPGAGDLQTSTDLVIEATFSCTPAIPAGWGVELAAVGDNSANDDCIERFAPYSCTFSLPRDEYTVTATVVDDMDNVVVGTGAAQDQITLVGIGDYYVAFGDSITSGRGGTSLTSADGRNSGTGYPPTLNNLLTAALDYPHTVINEGTEGELSADGANRIGSVLNAHPDAQRVLVMYGMNDARPSLMLPLPPTGPGSFEENMQTIITAIVNAGKEPVLAQVNIALSDSADDDEDDFYLNPDTGARSINIQAINQVVRDLATSNGLSIAPPNFYNLFLLGMRYETEYDDAIHPNGTGYQSMADLWRQVLEP